MRVFVAINLNQQERAGLEAAARPLVESRFPVRWVPVQNVHLTLKFLGEVDEGRLPELFTAVDGAAAGSGAFDMAAKGFGAFPSLRRPQIVWAGVEVNPTLSDLQERLETALETLGYPRERRRFHPHLTLGRTRKQARPSDFKGFEDLVGQLVYEDVLHAAAVDVMKSDLKRSGAVYSVIHTVSLEA
ncbi:MAG: RNA 2',3'-cyclic phosphodiesterase [Gemmatimonadales bacterium]|jgi:2'-5' RNA ligase